MDPIKFSIMPANPEGDRALVESPTDEMLRVMVGICTDHAKGLLAEIEEDKRLERERIADNAREPYQPTQRETDEANREHDRDYDEARDEPEGESADDRNA